MVFLFVLVQLSAFALDYSAALVPAHLLEVSMFEYVSFSYQEPYFWDHQFHNSNLSRSDRWRPSVDPDLWKYVTPLVDGDGHVTCARLLVYSGDTEEYVPDNSLLILASTSFICSLVSWYPS
jgi:hypothetical protein